MTEKYHGHATMADGTHVALSANEVKALIEMADASDKRRQGRGRGDPTVPVLRTRSEHRDF